jgi:hypothetical protein
MKLMFAVWVWGTMACSTDDRPERTLAYVTETVLAPTCAVAECHTAFKRQSGFAFDTVELAQESLAGGQDMIQLIQPCNAANTAAQTCPNDPDSSYLLKVIYDQDIYGDRMPYDSAMPDADKQLLTDWIGDGAPGFVPPSGPQ